MGPVAGPLTRATALTDCRSVRTNFVLSVFEFPYLIYGCLHFGALLASRIFLSYNDDIPTYPTIPLLFTPKDKIRSLHQLVLDDLRKGNPAVFRRINILKPWSGAEVICADPALLRDVFVGKNWQNFDRGHPVADSFHAYSGGFIHLRNGDTWRDMRNLFDRTFSTVNVRKYAPILLELRDIFMTQLEKSAKSSKDGAIDMYPFCHAYTFDVITRLTFGAEVKAQTTETGAHYAKSFEQWQENATVMFLINSLVGRWAWPLIGSTVAKWKKNGDTMYGLLDDQKARIMRGEGQPSIMKDLYDIVKEEKMPSTISDEALRAALMTLLFGGHDTTASLLSFTFYELSKRPDIQALIREEVNEIFANGPIDNLEPLERCKVLNAAIKETLRKYPSAPGGAGRVILEPFEHTVSISLTPPCAPTDTDPFQYTDMTGQPRTIKFQKWDSLSPHLYTVQNYEGFWKHDPTLWEPSRFYENANGDLKEGVGLFAFSPFGNGARRCLGERLAYGEARLTVASVVRKWTLEHVPETTWRMQEFFTGTIRPSEVRVKLVEVK